jgi:hypothetical protein
MKKLNYVGPIGTISFLLLGILLAIYTKLHGQLIHIAVVTPWTIFVIITCRETFKLRGSAAVIIMAILLIASGIIGELIQIFFPLHKVDILGMLRNFIAIIIGAFLYGMTWNLYNKQKSKLEQ